MARILVIDDDAAFLQSMKSLLNFKKYEVETVSHPEMAKRIVQERHFATVLMDVKMPGVEGLELLEWFLQHVPDTPVVMISGQSTITTAMDAIKLGAYDFLEKPVDAERLFIALRNAIEKHNWKREQHALLNYIDEAFPIVGESAAIRELKEQIQLLAPTDARVLILGESGVGKELVAQALHFKSQRRGGPFIKINCAAIPGDLLESELFGYRKGSFSGATTDYPGKFAAADSGSIFLDEIGDMDMRLQAKLLRVVETGEVETLGMSKPRKVDVRIIAATNKNIQQMVKDGKFREDLYHRLNVVTLVVPPLRDHVEDVPLLARYFLRQFSETYNKRVVDFSSAGMAMLMAYHWPGNVRELKNIVEKLVIFSTGEIISEAEVQQALPEVPNDPIPEKEKSTPRRALHLKDALGNFERDLILQALERNKWRIQETATDLGIDRSALYKKMQKYSIQRKTE